MSGQLSAGYPPEGYREALEGGLIPIADARGEDALDGVHLTALSSVKMQRARFIWSPRIPRAAVTLIAGLPGQGKSTLTAHLAARVSRGQLEGDLMGIPTPVLIATAEDALSFVVVPRLTAAGADLDLIHSVGVRKDGLDGFVSVPDDLSEVRERMDKVGAKLLIIDPLLAHIPVRVDGYKDQHVRVALAPLHQLAEELDAAVLGVMHLNKRETSDIFSRLGGSGGFLGAARSALLVAPDPSDPTVRVVAHAKANLTLLAPSLRFRLESREIPNNDPDDPEPVMTAAVAFLGESDVTAGDLLRSQGEGTKRSDAVGWLAQFLASGPMPHSMVMKVADEEGYSETTLKRAKRDLRVKSYREGGLAGEGRWIWALPD